MKIPDKYFTLTFLLLLFMALLTSRASAQKNLQYYLSEAMQNSPAVKENLSSIQLRHLDRMLNNAQYNMPQVSLSASYLFAPYFNNSRLVTTTPDSNAIGYDPSITNGGLYSAQINVTKNIFNHGLTNAYNEQTGIQISQSEHAIGLTRHTIQRDITDQYLLSYQSQQLYYLSRELKDTLSAELSITQALMLRGLARQTDYLLLKVELSNQQIALEQALNTYRNNLYELNTLCGISDTSMVNLQIAALTQSKPVSESNFLRQYSIDSMLIVSQQNVLETKYLPQLSIFANAGLNAVELTGIQKRFGMSAGFNFSYPIFDGGQKNITRQQSEISARIAGVQKDYQRITIQNKIMAILSQLDFYRRNMNAIAQQIKDYTNVIRLSRSELMQGQLTMVEFITILRNFLDLRKNEIQTSTAYGQAVNQFNYWNW